MMNYTAERKVVEIPAKTRPQLLGRKEIKQELVAAYCRVSTEKEEQEESYAAQVSYYTKYIKNRLDWQFVEIYADEGITGTQVYKRQNFLRMMEDCRLHKIDKIICKSISRFGRNTEQIRHYVQECKELGISVIFENEGIDTSQPGSEVLLTILASMAEQESRNISTNVKWGVQKRFANGRIMLNHTNFLGFTKDENKNLVVIPEEARIVKKIFNDFLNGYSFGQIAAALEREGIKSPTGKDKWYPSCIRSMLQNEKYKGSALLGKSFKTDVLSKKRKKNNGEVPSFYIENSHQAIISKQTFDLVKAELERRGSLRSHVESGEGKYSSKYAFSGMLYCGECGSKFRRYSHYYSGRKWPVWVCVNHQLNGNSECTMKPVKEDDIQQSFLKSISELIGDYDSLKTELLSAIQEHVTDEAIKQIEDYESRILGAQAHMVQLNKDKRAGQISEQAYMEKSAAVGSLIDELTEKKLIMEMENEQILLSEYRIKNMLELLSRKNMLETFDDTIFKNLIEKVLIYSKDEIEFVFNCGVTAKQEL